MTQQRPRLEDLEAIRHRYAAERDKRIREDGNDQYVEIAGDLAHYVDDPYVEPGFQREPIDKAVDALIIGCLLYTSPSPRDRTRSRMPSSA